MSLIKNKNGKIIRNNTVIQINTSAPPKTNWVEHTKKFSKNNNLSYGESLSNVKNRCQYYDTMIDRNKFNRGPHMLQPDHPAMHPFIPNLSKADKKIKDEILIQTKRHMCSKNINLKK